MKFKVGDRVAVYGKEGGSGMVCEGLRGTITEVCQSGWLKIKHGNSTWLLAHPKQCRLLKKKERRRIWIPEFQVKDVMMAAKLVGCDVYRAPYDGDGGYHLGDDSSAVAFVEMRRKK